MPGATYRLQFNRSFGFRDALRLLPFLESLGITDLYASPLVTSRPGSEHGYDVADPTCLDPELGSEEDFVALSQALRERGMGLLLDVVPNHMAASADNPWWVDVLRSGRRSRFAHLFDIDWEALGGRVLLPVLGAPYGEVLSRGQLRVEVVQGEPWVRYYDHRFPLDPASVARVPGSRDADSVTAILNDARGGFEVLDEVLAAQHYVLAYWRTASHRINYRRFFDIPDLVGVRVEDPGVFRLTHRLILRLARSGAVTGLRVDHVDGLWDPQRYLERLRDRAGCFVVVEKILERSEALPATWPVAGTTGYEALNALTRLLVDERGRRRLERLYRDVTGRVEPFGELVVDKKRLVLERLFTADVRWLAERLHGLARGSGREVGYEELRRAIVEVSASLPVYRTYVRSLKVEARDRRLIEEAVREASGRVQGGGGDALAFLRRVLLLELSGGPEEGEADRWLAFTQRWQQLTGAATAKGFEDSALYVFNSLLALNEVGGDPSGKAGDIEEFHRFASQRQRRWPHGLTATSTHDTKRSEDVRARLAVLSEIPEEWESHVQRWIEWNSRYRTRVGKREAPDRNEEYLLYQTLLGAWPLDPEEVDGFGERVEGFMRKALREAKEHTSWRDEQPEYEEAVLSFARAVLSPANRRWRRDFLALAERVAWHGILNALSQVVIKSCMPGVPDFYQGAETWHLRLVDPDNRSPVDFAGHAALLVRSLATPVEELLGTWRDSAVKAAVTARVLRFRRTHPELLARGAYVPLEVTGRLRAHVVAFARRRQREWVVVAAPRLTAQLCPDGLPVGTDVWGGAALVLPGGAPETWRDELTGRRARIAASGARRVLRLREVLEVFPLSVLAPASRPLGTGRD